MTSSHSYTLSVNTKIVFWWFHQEAIDMIREAALLSASYFSGRLPQAPRIIVNSGMTFVFVGRS
jgi:hypothetical protein